MDGGKPIRESRDVDVPLAAAHFFHYAGWADKLSYGMGGRAVEPLGVAGADRALELPAADGRVEARAGARVRQHRRAEAGGDHAGDRAAARRDHPGGRAAAGRRVDHPRRRRARAPRSCASRTSTRWPSPGSTAVGKNIQAALAGRGIPLTLELGGKSANIVFEDAALDQAVEGIVNGIFFNQGHVCCAGSRLLIQESVAETVVDEAVVAHGAPARGRPARQEHRRGRDQLARAARADRVARGER